MILLVHMLFGAVTATLIQNPYWAVIFAFLGHYFLDVFPHIEYPINNIINKNWHKSLPQIISVAIDFFLGMLFIFLFSSNQPIIYACVFFAILPDGFSLLGPLFKNNKFLQKHSDIHQVKIHYFKHKKISTFWRIFSQILVVIISLFVLQK